MCAITHHLGSSSPKTIWKNVVNMKPRATEAREEGLGDEGLGPTAFGQFGDAGLADAHEGEFRCDEETVEGDQNEGQP